MEEKKDFIGYEYKTVEVRKELEELWADGCANYGWEIIKREAATVKHLWGPLRVMAAPLALLPGTPFAKLIVDHESEKKSLLTFHRNKVIESKQELNRLQHQFEVNAKEIEHLETSKNIGPAAVACTVGLAGTVWMGLATFAYLGGNIPACIIFAIPGILGWLLPVFIYKWTKKGKTEKVKPLLEHHYEVINQINEKGYGFL